MKEFENLYSEALAEAYDEVNAQKDTITPMVVSGGGKKYFVADGVCGFAWVNVKPGTSKFARWLKATGKARTDSYYGGVTIWVSDFGQSMQKKEIFARALAKRFQAAGIKAYAASRMD